MRGIVTIVALVIGIFIAFSYFHSLSIDRARLIHSANDLLVAHQRLRQYGSLTNFSGVLVFTNRVIVGGAVFDCQFVADAPHLTEYGTLVVATEGTVIWIDKKTGPKVVRNADGRIEMPRRFHDF